MLLKKLRLDERVAVVVGGGCDTGLASCETMTEAGAHIFIADIAMDVTEEGCSYLNGKNLAAEDAPFDATNTEAITQFPEAAVHSLTRSLTAERTHRGVRVNV